MLQPTLEQLIEQFALLKQVLADESDALERRDPDALVSAAGTNHACAVQIGQLEDQLRRSRNGKWRTSLAPVSSRS